jgi:TPR repeat protein
MVAAVKRLMALLPIPLSLATGQALAGLAEGLAAFAAQDFERARAELMPLAGRNDPIASYHLGLLFMDGQGSQIDTEAGIWWLTRAAENGHAGAQLRLASAYDVGEGVVQDYRSAARWMAEAAYGGKADAQYYLGQYYRIGRGVVQDDAQAFEWIHRSVEYGISHDRVLDALLYLGGACEWGRGLRQDLVEAYKWFSLAASYSMNDARMLDEASRAMDALRIRMSTTDLAVAGKRAHEWREEKIAMYGLPALAASEARQ